MKKRVTMQDIADELTGRFQEYSLKGNQQRNRTCRPYQREDFEKGSGDGVHSLFLS